MSVRVTLVLHGHRVTFGYEPLPSGVAQVFVCARSALVVALRPRARLRLREALRSSPRNLYRDDGRWAVFGAIPWGGDLYRAVTGAFRVEDRAELVVIDPRRGDHGERVTLEPPPPAPVPFEDDDGEDYETAVESFLTAIVAR